MSSNLVDILFDWIHGKDEKDDIVPRQQSLLDLVLDELAQEQISHLIAWILHDIERRALESVEGHVLGPLERAG